MAGIIIILFCVGLLVVLTRKTLDRETARNMKFFGKLLAAVVAALVIFIVLSFLLSSK